jgi:hypothetical protein
MALNEDWVQKLLRYDVTLEAIDGEGNYGGSEFSDSGNVGRAWIDGCLVVYDLEDPPFWLAAVQTCLDEDGNMIVHPDGTPALQTIIRSRIVEEETAHG